MEDMSMTNLPVLSSLLQAIGYRQQTYIFSKLTQTREIVLNVYISRKKTSLDVQCWLYDWRPSTLLVTIKKTDMFHIFFARFDESISGNYMYY